MGSCTTTISSCGNYTISRICLPDIYQGENAVIELTLLDKLGNPVDLTTVNKIEILLYGLDTAHKIVYAWPDITSTATITILQNGSIDIGKISFVIPNTYTVNSVSGLLCGNIRINLDSDITGDSSYNVTFPGIQIANIVYTELNFIDNATEEPPDNWMFYSDSTLTGEGTFDEPLSVANPFTLEDSLKLSLIEDGAQVNIQSDWLEADSSAESYIKNKQHIPINSDFTLMGLSEKSYNSLTDTPVIPIPQETTEVEIKITPADWAGSNSCTKLVTGITTNSFNDIVFMSSYDQLIWSTFGLFALEEVIIDGEQRFTCTSTPTADINIKIRITK